MFSLIVATANRTAELECLLASLDAQTCRDFEVIIVDQNPDDRLTQLLREHDGLQIQHLRSDRGLSKARNVGLRAAKGDLIAIPDDDCWYSPELLSTVAAWFASHPEIDMLLAITRNSEGRAMVPKFAPGPGTCDRRNVWRCAVSNGMFFRRCVNDAVGFFNESIGVGAPTDFQSSEETDYVLRTLSNGFRVWYEPRISVFHSEYQSLERVRSIVYRYALGTGYVARLHNFPVWFLAGQLLRSFGGAALHLLRGSGAWAQVYFSRGLGQLHGYRHAAKSSATKP